MNQFIKRFLSQDRGVTAIEYALIAGLIAVALTTSMGTLTTAISTAFTNIAKAL
jgi:pilus assembly protein Flp/PilA